MTIYLPLAPEHLPQVTKIYAHYVRQSTATFELDPPVAREMERRAEAVLRGGLPYWVAVDDEGVIG
jgi:L-amino acid N-acyltransferase YncA